MTPKEKKLREEFLRNQNSAGAFESFKQSTSTKDLQDRYFQQAQNQGQDGSLDRRAMRSSYLEAKQYLGRQADKTAAQAFNPRFSDSFRNSALAAANKSIDFASPVSRERIATADRELGAKRFRSSLNQAQQIQDPAQQAQVLSGLVSSGSNLLGRDHQLVNSAQKAQARASRHASDSSQFTALTGSDAFKGAGASEKHGMLQGVQLNTETNTILKQISKLMSEQTLVIKSDNLKAREEAKQTRNEQKTQKAAAQTASGKFESMMALYDQKTQEKKAVTSGRIAVAGALTDMAFAGLDTYTNFRQRQIPAVANAYTTLGQIRGEEASKTLGALTDYSGRGRIERFGDVLYGTSDSKFLGASGGRNAGRVAGNEANETRTNEQIQAGSIIGKGVVSALTSIIGGVTLGGVPGIAAGITGVSSAISGAGNALLDNRAAREFMGSGLANESKVDRFRAAQIRTKELTEADVSAKAVEAANLDRAFASRTARAADIEKVGSSAFSSTAALGNFSGWDNASAFRSRIFNKQIPGMNASADWGLTESQRDSMRTDTMLSMGRGATAGQASSNTETMLGWEKSGRGSVGQNQGILTNLTRQMGQTNAMPAFSEMMEKSVEKGFNNSRLTKEFIENITQTAAANGMTDPTMLLQLVTRAMSANGGQGDFSLKAAEKAGRQQDNLEKNNPYFAAQKSAAINKLATSLGEHPGAATFANEFGDMGSLARAGFIEGLTDTKKRPRVSEENRSAYYVLTGGKDLKDDDMRILGKKMREASLDATFGGQRKRVEDAVKSLSTFKGTSKQKTGALEALLTKDNQMGLTGFIGSNAELVNAELAMLFPGYVPKEPKSKTSAKDDASISRWRSSATTQRILAAGDTAMAGRGESDLAITADKQLMRDIITKGGMKDSSVTAAVENGANFGTSFSKDKIKNIMKSDNFFQSLMGTGKGDEDSRTLLAGMKNSDIESIMNREDIARVDARKEQGIGTVQLTNDTITNLSRKIGEAVRMPIPASKDMAPLSDPTRTPEGYVFPKF